MTKNTSIQTRYFLYATTRSVSLRWLYDFKINYVSKPTKKQSTKTLNQENNDPNDRFECLNQMASILRLN